jgi:hypothetical protein
MRAENERLRVLRMVEEGKVEPEEGARLLEAIRDMQKVSSERVASKPAASLRIRVQEAGRQKVNIAVPLSLARVALKLLPESAREQMGAQGLDPSDLGRLVSQVEKAGPLRILDVEDGDDRVEVFVE